MHGACIQETEEKRDEVKNHSLRSGGYNCEYEIIDKQTNDIISGGTLARIDEW